jgi:hypothetical protein
MPITTPDTIPRIAGKDKFQQFPRRIGALDSLFIAQAISANRIPGRFISGKDLNSGQCKGEKDGKDKKGKKPERRSGQSLVFSISQSPDKIKA